MKKARMSGLGLQEKGIKGVEQKGSEREARHQCAN
jgi:hypothetical protein